MTITYKEITNSLGEKYIEKTDGEMISIVPIDLGNRDYQAYVNKDTLPSNSADPAEKPKK
jgi:hypothetical protein